MSNILSFCATVGVVPPRRSLSCCCGLHLSLVLLGRLALGLETCVNFLLFLLLLVHELRAVGDELGNLLALLDQHLQFLLVLLVLLQLGLRLRILLRLEALCVLHGFAPELAVLDLDDLAFVALVLNLLVEDTSHLDLFATARSLSFLLCSLSLPVLALNVVLAGLLDGALLR